MTKIYLILGKFYRIKQTAEGEGVEPSRAVTHYRLSKAAPSATRRPFHETFSISNFRFSKIKNLKSKIFIYYTPQSFPFHAGAVGEIIHGVSAGNYFVVDKRGGRS